MWKKSSCKHDWYYFYICDYPVLYRRCKICDRAEYYEMPMAVWKYIPTAKEVLNREYITPITGFSGTRRISNPDGSLRITETRVYE